MATYMVKYQLESVNRNEAIKRFMHSDAAKAPEGLKEIGRWHRASADGGYVVVETDDPTSITNWVLQWSDVMSYEIEATISDEELGGLLQKHGF